MNRREIVLASLMTGSARMALGGDKVSKEFKKAIEGRYSRKDVVPTFDGIVLGLDQPIIFVSHAFGVRITHFHAGLEIPKDYLSQERLDERTFLDKTFVQVLTRIPPGERLFAVSASADNSGVHFVLFSQERQETTVPERSLYGIQNQRYHYGVNFSFRFPREVMESDDPGTVFREIDRYLPPANEARHKESSQKKIDIQPGMSRDEVIKALGEPTRSITFGKKTILTYEGLSVVLEENRVVDVTTN